MQTLKNYFKNLKLQNCIDDILMINELHFVKESYFQNIINALKSIQKSKNQDIQKIFRQFFSKYRSNQKQTLRLLMILHEILRHTDNHETSESIIDLLFKQCQQLQQISDEELSKMDLYLKKSFAIPYLTYLIKGYRKQVSDKLDCLNERDTRLMLNRKETTITNKNSNKGKENEIMDFTIFNHITDIVKLSPDLHQMGRYYSDHQYAINIYLEILKDFEIYFKRIQASFANLITLNKNEVTDENAQKIYLYLSESERSVSKMNSFYYNKYLFYYVNDKISLKMQLEIPQNFYKVLNKSQRGNQKTLAFDFCLTATHTGNKNLLPDTKESNRSKPNNFSKIAASIASMSQTLQQMQNLEKIQMQKENQQNLRKSALF